MCGTRILKVIGKVFSYMMRKGIGKPDLSFRSLGEGGWFSKESRACRGTRVLGAKLRSPAPGTTNGSQITYFFQNSGIASNKKMLKKPLEIDHLFIDLSQIQICGIIQ